MKKLSSTFIAILICFTAKCQTTGYGYVARDSSSQVNWNNVSNDLNQALKKASEDYLNRLKAAGWSSEEEYIAYKRNLKAQKRLQKKYENGDPDIKISYDKNGNATYYKQR
jgi:hypothetical protein